MYHDDHNIIDLGVRKEKWEKSDKESINGE
jgi:hypothetical protein